MAVCTILLYGSLSYKGLKVIGNPPRIALRLHLKQFDIVLPSFLELLVSQVCPEVVLSFHYKL